MGAIIFTVILVAVAIGLIAFAITAKKRDYFGAFIGTLIAGILAFVGGIAILIGSTYYSNSDGEAKVIINSVDRTVQGTVITAGSGWKSPLEDFVPFDLFSQPLVFAGAAGAAPSYTGGAVNGAEVTVNVGGVNGGSTRANVDFVANYYLSTDAVERIYKEYRSQKAFTEQVIVPKFLEIARNQSAYTAIEFRGAKQAEAGEAVRVKVNEVLKDYGVEFRTLTIQDARFPDNVEQALNAIEEANQAAQKAEAEKRTSEVNAEKNLIEAQGRAQAQIAEAQGEAEANRVLSESLTPAVIQQRQTEALMKAAESGKLIVSGNSSPLLQVPTE